MIHIFLDISSKLRIPNTQIEVICKLFEDNKGSEEFSKVPNNRQRTKHIEIKYHHLIECVKYGK